MIVTPERNALQFTQIRCTDAVYEHVRTGAMLDSGQLARVEFVDAWELPAGVLRELLAGQG